MKISHPTACLFIVVILVFTLVRPAAAEQIQMLPPVDPGSGTAADCRDTSNRVLMWNGTSSVKCASVIKTDESSNTYISGNTSINGNLTTTGTITSSGSLTATGDITTSGNITASSGNVTSQTVDATSYKLNGSSVAMIDPTQCHSVHAVGPAPNYISNARCGDNEIMINGGGRVETPGSDLCAGTTKGILHYSAPDPDMRGWTVDGYSFDYSGEACTEAIAFCCPVR